LRKKYKRIYEPKAFLDTVPEEYPPAVALF
jgi:hypothetical protein